MCGIAGLYAYSGRVAEPSADELQRISTWQRYRGPDDHGQWRSADGRCLLDHRRLAIIDPSAAGHQPMLDRSGRLAISFNGEIYNYRELRAGLEQAGAVFVSGSDTEVLLRLYEIEGEAMLSRLRGMFAFAIWDEDRKSLFLARDPLGIKPLYYSADGEMFRFASLARALLAGGGIACNIEPGARAGFLLWGSVPEPLTWWSNIRILPAGHWLRVDQNGVGIPKAYVDLAAEFAAPATGQAVAFADAISQTVAYHMVADVPVGIFLSAGVDSVALASLACRHARDRLQSVTVSFDAFASTDRDESATARQLAAALGMSHSIVHFGQDDFERHRTDILRSMDQPTIDGINTYFVSMAARDVGLKVALSGVGGDELLGGYPSFRQVPAVVQQLRHLGISRGIGRQLRRLAAPFVGLVTSPKYASLFEYGTTLADAYFLRRGLFMPWELDGLLGREEAAQGLERLKSVAGLEEPGVSPHAAIAYFELSAYMRNQLLRDTDWSGMRHGVEVRVPFADASLVRQLAPAIASSRPPTKADLAACIDTQNWEQLAQQPKRGFEVPVRSWLAGTGSRFARLRGWRGWAMEVLTEFDALALRPREAGSTVAQLQKV